MAVPTNGPFTAMAGGYVHWLALTADGKIATWGVNNSGECTLPSPNRDFLAIGASQYYSLRLTAAGQIFGSGDNFFGQCWPPAPNRDFVAMEAGSFGVLGLKTDGTIVGWGDNQYGQGNVPEPNGFFKVPVGIQNITPAGVPTGTPSTITISGVSLGAGGTDIVSVIVCDQPATIVYQDTTQVVVTVGAFASPTNGDVVAHSAIYGPTLWRKGFSAATMASVLTGTASDFTATSAVCRGTVLFDGGNPATLRGMCWSTNPAPTIADQFVSGGEGAGAFTNLLTGLLPQRTYSYRAVVSNAAGITYGSVSNFVTTKFAQSIVFASPGPQITTNSLHLAATASSGLPVSFAVESGPASLASGSNLTFTGAGQVSVVAAQAGDGAWAAALTVTNTFMVTKAVAPVTLNNLGQVYNGAARTVTATTVPGGLSVGMTYNGRLTAPTNAGSYAVTGTVSAAELMYQGSATGVLVVGKAGQGITFPNPGAQITTNVVMLSASSTSGLEVAFSVLSGPVVLNGATLTFTNAGTVQVVAAQAGDGNWSAAPSVTNAFTVTKAGAIVTLGSLSQTYNGSARIASAATTPAGLAVGITYNGSPIAPTNVGSYAVTGTVSAAEPMYQGSAAGTLVVAKANQGIAFPNPGAQITTNVVTLSASSTSGLAVAFSVASGPAVLNGTTLTFTNAGIVQLAATQAGDGNWNAAPSVTNAFTVTKAVAQVTLGSLNQPYDGTARIASAATAPAGLAVVITYNGSPVAPTNAGSYAVTGTVSVSEPMYQGVTAGTLVVTKAVAPITLSGLSQAYDGTARVVAGITMPAGLVVVVTYNGSTGIPTNAGSYAVTGVVTEANYQGSTNGTLVVAKAEQGITFPNPGAQITTNVVTLSASATSGLAVAFSVLSGPAVLDGATLTFTNAGAVQVVASQAGNGNWNPAPFVTNTITVTKAVAPVTLNSLSQVYNGSARVVTATTVPSGLTVGITYNGGSVAPTNAGSYAVTGTVSAAEPMYQGSAADTLVVAKADQGITFPNPGAQITTNVVTLSATATSGLAVAFSVLSGPAVLDGVTLTFTNAGTVQVVAAQPGDGNWNPAISVTNTFGVTKAIALVTLNNLSQTYDRTARIVTVSTVPAGLQTNVTYNGSPVAPTNAGSYAVTGAVSAAEPMYQGSAAGTLVVAKADQGITFPNLGAQITTNVVTLTATSTSSLAVAFSVLSGPAVLDGATLTFTNAGTVQLVASQAGDGNWNAAPSVTNSFTVTKAVALVTLNNLSQVYNGAARIVTVSTVPVGLQTNVTYNGSPVAPTNAGSYAVTGAVSAAEPMYQGSSFGTLVVAKADQGITFPNPGAQITTNVVTLSATSTSGLAVAFSVLSGPAVLDGATLTFTNAGTVQLVAAQAGDGNWNAAISVTNTFGVTKAIALVTLNNLSQTYDRTARIVTVSTTPAGLQTNVTYNGSPVAPTNAGSYAVTGTVSAAEPMYQGSEVGTLVVAKADQGITFPNPGAQITTNVVTLSASATSGLAVAFSVLSGPAVLDGATLTFTNAGTVQLVAAQAGDGNWNAAISVTNTFGVTKAVAQVTLNNLSQTYDRTARIVTVSTVPAGLQTNVTYNGSPVAPTNAGSYAVTGTVSAAEPMYQGSAAGTLVVAKADQGITFPNPGAQITTNVVTLSASATSGLAVAFSVLSGPAVLDGAILTFTNAGTVQLVAAQAGDGNWNAAPSVTNAFTVTKAFAQVTLNNLSQTYDRTARIVTVSTTPAGLQTNVTYNGSPVAPTNAGSYAVTGTVNAAEPMYQGSAAGTLVVAKADQGITFPNPGAQITTNVVTLTATSTSGLAVAFSVLSGPAVLNGSTLTFTNAGTVQLVAAQGGDGNWNAALSVTNSFTVTKAVAQVTLNNLSQVYNGAARIVTVSTVPAGLQTNVTYNGSLVAPTNAGSYAVTGTVSAAEPMYQGSAAGTLVVAKADQGITFPNPGAQITTNVVTLSATSTSGLAVAFSVLSGPAVLDGATLTFTNAGTVQLVASQAGDGNWNPAPSVTNAFAVTKAVAQVTLGSLNQTYDGTARIASAATIPTGLAVTMTYNGSLVAPTNAGSYAVTGTVSSAMYQGWTNGTLNVNKAIASVALLNLGQIEDGTARIVTATTTPTGLTVAITYDGHAWAPTNAGSYAVTGTISDVNYQGMTNGTLSVTKLVDLAATQTAAPDPVWAGNTLTYTLIITNNGPSGANSLVVTSTLPSQVVYQSAGSTPGWSVAGGQGTFTMPTLAANRGTNLVLVVKVNSGFEGVVTNSVRVHDVNTDPVPANNTSSLSASVQKRADLSVSAVSAPEPVVAGSNLVYTVVITNLGPSDAAGVVVTSALPAAVTLVGGGSPGWAMNGGAAVYTAGILAAGCGSNLTLTVAVDSACLGLLTNVISVSAVTADPAMGNNTATSLATVVARVDLSVSQAPLPAPAVAGSNVSYVITVTNRGPSDAVGVVVTDSVPAYVTSIGGTPSGWIHAGGVSSFVIGRMKPGAVTNISLQMAVPSSAVGSLTNGATVYAATTDYQPGNNTSTHMMTLDVRANLKISKIDLADPVIAGLTNVYVITVTNQGPSDAVGLVVTDSLPAVATYTASGSSAGWTSNGQSLTMAVPVLAALQTTSYTVRTVVAASALGLITNTVTVATPTFDPVLADNSAQETTMIQGLADLAVTMTDAPDPVYVGSNLTYTVSVTNAGPSDAVSMVVTAMLPSAVTFSAGGSPGWVNNAGVATYSLARLPVGARTNLALQVSVSALSDADLTNAVTVSAATADPLLSNNSVTEATRVLSIANLAIGVGAPASALPGDAVLFTVGVTNLGANFAAGVVVTASVPVLVRVSLAGSTPGWTGAGTQWTFSLGLMTNGARTNLTLKGFLDPLTPVGTILSNDFQVGGRVMDPVLANNRAAALVVASLTSRIYNFEALSNGNLIGQDNWKRDLSQSMYPAYEAAVWVASGTGSNATKVAQGIDSPTNYSDRVNAMRPNNAAFSFPTYTGKETNAVYQFDVQYSVLRWTNLMDMGGGMVWTNTGTNYGKVARVAPLLSTNPVPGYGAALPIGFSFGLNYNVYDPNPAMKLGVWYANSGGNMTPYYATNLPASVRNGDWLRLKLVVDLATPSYGTTNGSGVLYVQNLSRSETNFTKMLTASDLLLGNLYNLGYTPNVWTGAWVEMDHEAGMTNGVNVKLPWAIDNIAMGETDMGVTKTANGANGTVGSNLTYTVTVTNNGPLAATGSKVMDMLPEGMSFVSASVSRGTWTQEAGVVTWTVGTLSNRLGATLTVVGVPGVAGTATNRVLVLAGLHDSFTNNNLVALTTPILAGPVATYTVQVVSAWSTASPAAGSYALTNGSPVAASVVSPVTGSTTQYVSAGWSMAGNAPATGTGTNFAMTVTNHATLTWLWNTNVMFARSAGANGSVTGPTNGWYAIGGSVTVTAVPNATFQFAGWSGDVAGGESSANPLTLTLNRAKTIQAAFSPASGGSTYTVQVVSAYGTASPAVGLHARTNGESVTLRVASPDVLGGVTQVVATGWTVIGNSPAGGSGTNFTMTVTNNATVTWIWGVTNVAFSRSAGQNGAVAGSTNGWYPLGGSVTVTAVPNAYYHFDQWTGDVTGNPSGNPLPLVLNRTRSVMALFAQTVGAAQGTPESWLAQYGLTGNVNTLELSDSDGDGLSNWEEYIAGTDPTSGVSALTVQEIGFSASGTPVFTWPTVSGRVYSVYYSTDLSADNGGFQPAASNLGPSANTFTDPVRRGSAVFYKISVTKP